MTSHHLSNDRTKHVGYCCLDRDGTGQGRDGDEGEGRVTDAEEG